MSSARDEILARVRAAKGATASASPIPRDYRRAAESTSDQLVSMFCERVAGYKAEVERVSAAGALPTAIAAAAAHHRARRLVVPPQLPDTWRPAGLALIADAALTPRELDDLDGVITGSTVAIAETGTIVLSAAPDEGRRALTLVPDLHICVVREDQIVGTVPEAIAHLAAITRTDGRPITLISGPSATSDIELRRIEGVHGPRKLVVLVVSRD